MNRILSLLVAVGSVFLAVSPATGAMFASRVVSYDTGVGFVPRFTHPEAALGEPSRTNPFGEITDPFNPPYGTNQVVSIGAGGHLVLGFDTPVLNHPKNLYGLDFTVFGNAGFIITNEFDLVTYGWVGMPATDGTLFGAGSGQILLSVSRDGEHFFLLNPIIAPALDGFAPTDSSGHFGIPLDPSLSVETFAGATLERIRELYAGSAGGANFDLAWALDVAGGPIFLPEVRYIRIDVLNGRAEVDGVSTVNRERRKIRIW